MSILITENLTLREFTLSDSNQYYKYIQDEEIQKYMPYLKCPDENRAIERLEWFIENYSEKKLTYYNLAIVKTDINKLIGHIGIGIWDISESEQGYEIEYAIGKDYRGFHYATEALAAFTPWCKSKFGIDKVYALVRQQNIASCKALLNAGFVLCEMEFENKKNSQRNVYVY